MPHVRYRSTGVEPGWPCAHVFVLGGEGGKVFAGLIVTRSHNWRRWALDVFVGERWKWRSNGDGPMYHFCSDDVAARLKVLGALEPRVGH